MSERLRPASKRIPPAVLDALLAAALDQEPRSRFLDLPSPIPLQPEASGGGFQVILRQVDYDGTVLSSSPLGAS